MSMAPDLHSQSGSQPERSLFDTLPGRLKGRSAAYWMLALFLVPGMVLAMPLPRYFGIAPYIFGAGAVILLPILKKRALQFINLPLCAGVLSLLALGWVSLLWSQDVAMSLDRATKLTLFCLSGLAATGFAAGLGSADRDGLRQLLPLAFAVGALVLLVDCGFGHPLYRMMRGIPAEMTVMPSVANPGAVILSLMFWPVLLALSYQVSRSVQSLFLLLALLAVTQTASQSASFGMMFGLGGWLAAALFPRQLIRAVFLLLWGGGMVLAPWIADALFQFQPQALMAWETAAAPERIAIWGAVAQKILDAPFWGYGLEASRMIGPLDIDQSLFPVREVLHPHNAPLQLWLNFGIAGAIMGAALPALALLQLEKLPPREYRMGLALLACCLGIFLAGYGIWQTWLIGLVFAAATAFTALRQREDNQPR